MTRPSVTATAEAVYADLGPALTAPDADNGWALLELVDAAVTVLAGVDAVVRGTADSPHPWSVLFDADLVPAGHLRWLAQVVGVTLPDELSEVARRERIKDRPATRRGTPARIREAVSDHLRGTRTVQITERDGGPHLLSVDVWQDEIAGLTYNALSAQHGTYADLAAAHATYDDFSSSESRLQPAADAAAPAWSKVTVTVNPGSPP